MTTQTGAIPTWTLADRLRKARAHANLEQDELAEKIGIARQSVSNYERGQTAPNRPIIWAWADITGVDRVWLLGDGDDSRRPQSLLPRLDSNQQPAGNAGGTGQLPRLDSNQQPFGYGVPDPVILAAERKHLRERVPLGA